MLTSQGPELSVRSRFSRRRGRVRRLKHTSKSAGCHFIRKRIAESKDQLYQQYKPCGCQSACGKQCPCLTNGTCCEKYCGWVDWFPLRNLLYYAKVSMHVKYMYTFLLVIDYCRSLPWFNLLFSGTRNIVYTAAVPLGLILILRLDYAW